MTQQLQELQNKYDSRTKTTILTNNQTYFECYEFNVAACIYKLYSHYSYLKFKVLIIIILNNTHDVVDFDSL